MYKVIKIHHWTATRDIELLNENTGTKDLCFDDSALISFNNFEFMLKDCAYNCKIALLGSFSQKKTATSVEVKVVNSEVVIGKKLMIEVQVDKDIYYIPKADADKINIDKKLYFDFTRKDLIQVNNVIHNDLL